MSEIEGEREKLINPKSWHDERSVEYAVEALEPVELTEEDRVRGARFVEAIRAINSATEGVFAGMTIITGHEPLLGVRKDGIIVIEPVYPVRRFVHRGDGMYTHTSPDETSYSTKPVLVEYFQFFKADERHDAEVQAEGAIAVKAHSPDYRGSWFKGNALEEVVTLDLLAHPLAIHPIKGYLRNRSDVVSDDE